jgi:hypothetical protein
LRRIITLNFDIYHLNRRNNNGNKGGDSVTYNHFASDIAYLTPPADSPSRPDSTYDVIGGFDELENKKVSML